MSNIYSFLLNLSSNQKYYASSSGTTLCTVASIVMAMQYVQEMKKELIELKGVVETHGTE